jgi:hypothetical protein
MGLAEVMNKLIFNNLHNPPPAKYFDAIINPLYSKQLLNLVLVEDCGGYTLYRIPYIAYPISYTLYRIPKKFQNFKFFKIF